MMQRLKSSDTPTSKTFAPDEISRIRAGQGLRTQAKPSTVVASSMSGSVEPDDSATLSLRGVFASCAAVALLGAVYIWKFPGALFLGDGWIFLQYARNLAAGHGWSFNPGETSFGATSPAWVV